MTAVAQRVLNSQTSTPRVPVAAPAALSLREAVSQVNDSSRNLLGLMALANAADRDLNSGSPETTLDGVISKAVLRSLLGALHFRDLAALRHSRRVALLAAGLAHHLGWEGRHLRVLEVAALLHDIGKIGVPDCILYKPGKLCPEEMELMEIHQDIGLNMLQACRVDGEVLKIVEEAHRAYKVSGGGNQSIRNVHIGARILAVADAYESLCTEQVYRRAKSHEEIMTLLMEESGKQFDGNVVNSLARWVQQDGLPFAAQTAEPHETSNRPVQVSLEEAAEAMALCQIFSYLYMLESLYDGFSIVDANRRFIVWNHGLEQLTGHSASEMLGQPWSSELITGPAEGDKPSESQEQSSSMDDAIGLGKSLISQFQYARPNRDTLKLELQTVPLFDVKGRLFGAAEIYRNLSRMVKIPELKQLKLEASRDALTSVANRGELERQLEILTQQFAENPEDPFSVIFADADHFKRVNDTYGHQVGDQVLIDLAKHFNNETYSGEIVGRYGGEEFVILCPSTSLEQAVRRADRLRNSLMTTKVGGVDKLNITCSFGVAQMEPADTTETLVRRADMALYEAKASGRNRTFSYTTEELIKLNNGQQSENESGQPFQSSGSFTAVLASEIVVHKLAGFVKDHKAVLDDVTHERVLMQIPAAGWLAYFGTSPDRQALEIELRIEKTDRSGDSTKMRIYYDIRPTGWFRNRAAFETRTKSMAKALKQYFVAE